MRRLAIAPLLLTAVACGGPSAAPTAVRTVGTSPATTPPAKPRATASPTATPARPAATRPPTTRPSTPPAVRPTAQPVRAAGAGDVDGDGRRDAVRITGGDDSLATGTWRLAVALAAGGTVSGVVTADPQVRPEVFRVVDADGDGDAEVFVRVGGGASTTAYVPFTLVEDGMAEVRTSDGAAVRLLAGGSVTHGDGFSCADVDRAPGRELVVLAVVSDEGTTFRGTRRTYRWRSDRVELLSAKTFSGRQGDPAVQKSYEADCL